MAGHGLQFSPEAELTPELLAELMRCTPTRARTADLPTYCRPPTARSSLRLRLAGLSFERVGTPSGGRPPEFDVRIPLLNMAHGHGCSQHPRPRVTLNERGMQPALALG